LGIDTVQDNTQLPRAENWFVFLFSPNGRIPRKRYWLAYVLPATLIYIVASIIDGAIVAGGSATGDDPPRSLLTGLAYLFFLWPSFAVIIKRLHDRGMSGWWSLLANGYIPFVIIFAVAAYWYQAQRNGGGTPADPTATAMFGIGVVVAVLVWLFFLVQIGFVRGQVGPNAYGDDPLPTPEAVNIDNAVTIVFAVLTAFFLLIPISAAYWYYTYKTANLREQHTRQEPLPTDEGGTDAPASVDGTAPSDEAPADGSAPADDAAPTDGTPPADEAPPPQ
jgi:uncharacterized membrane protein YhaH (DUF805 family)